MLDSFESCVITFHNILELDNFIKTSTKVMKRAKFHIRGWGSTTYSSFDNFTLANCKMSLLDLTWNISSDTFQIDSELLNVDESVKISK